MDGADLYDAHLNPKFARLLRLTGFDRRYVSAQGACLVDDRGTEYLDFIAGYAVHAVGRNHPTVVAALQRVLASSVPGWVQFERNELATTLAAELARRMPAELPHAFFTNSGTEAVECALKLARRFTGRSAVVHCEKSFHGMTLGALAANGNPSQRAGFGALGESTCIPMNDLVALERALAPGRAAAFIIEPVQGKSCIAVDDGYLAEATRLCRRHGTLLVVDEVQTGIGRTGRFLACQHDPGCVPDIVLLAKALSGGFVPVGVAMVRRDVWNATFDSMAHSLVHSSTFHEGPLAMTAALTVLQIHDDDRLSERAAQLGAQMRAGLGAAVQRHAVADAVHGRGLMLGVALRKGAAERAMAALPLVGGLERVLFGQAFAMEMLDQHRILCQVTDSESNLLKFTPPLIVSEDQVARAVRAADQTFEALGGGAKAMRSGIGRVMRNAVATTMPQGR